MRLSNYDYSFLSSNIAFKYYSFKGEDVHMIVSFTNVDELIFIIEIGRDYDIVGFMSSHFVIFMLMDMILKYLMV